MSRLASQISFLSPGSTSRPFLDLSKNFGDLFGQVRGRGATAEPAQQTFRDLGSQLGQLFETYGAGQRQAINQRFDVQRANVLGSLAKRGFSGSSLLEPTSSATERDRSLSLGAFEDQLLGQRIGAAQNVAQGLAGAQLGQANLDQQLREALLGLTSSSARSGGGGGGGRSGGGGGDFESSIPDFFSGAVRRALGGGGGGGFGGSGGGGSGGSISQPAFIDNPFGGAQAGGEGGVPAWGDPETAKAMGGFSSTGPPGNVGETYTVGGLTCTVTANKGNWSERTCVPTAAIGQEPSGGGPENATGAISGDLGDYGSVA